MHRSIAHALDPGKCSFNFGAFWCNRIRLNSFRDIYHRVSSPEISCAISYVSALRYMRKALSTFFIGQDPYESAQVQFHQSEFVKCKNIYLVEITLI